MAIVDSTLITKAMIAESDEYLKINAHTNHVMQNKRKKDENYNLIKHL